MTRTATRMQDAVRLLMLIDAAAEPLAAAPIDDTALATAVGVVRTQVRLQKLDFWVRNPDYLANELLNDDESGDHDPALLQCLAGLVVALVVDPQGGFVDFDCDDLAGITQPDLHPLADDLGAAAARHRALHSDGPLVEQRSGTRRASALEAGALGRGQG